MDRKLLFIMKNNIQAAEKCKTVPRFNTKSLVRVGGSERITSWGSFDLDKAPSTNLESSFLHSWVMLLLCTGLSLGYRSLRAALTDTSCKQL